MYVAQDRPGILYATNTVASFKLKRLVRYLVGFSRAEWACSRQAVPKSWTCTVKATGQVTTSEIARPLELQRSSEVICSTPGQRRNVALSSAEAEFHACNRRTAGGLQTCHFLTDAVYEVIPRWRRRLKHIVPTLGLSASFSSMSPAARF